MRIWYEQAFGSLRNVMNLSFKVRPSSKVTTQARYFVEISNYEMFPEMIDEFSPSDYKKNELLEMIEYIDEDDNETQLKEWTVEIERPYGSYAWKIKYMAVTNDPNEELDDLPMSKNNEGLQPYRVDHVQEPKPISWSE